VNRRRSRRAETDAELDVTAVLSLIIHLIPMLLLGVRFATFAHLPASGPVVPTRETPEEGRVERQSKQVVSVRITDRGFVVGGAGDVDPLLPCRGDCAAETYDYAGLSQAMVEAKRLHPLEQRVVLAPEAAVPFDVVVRAMDATREVRSAKEGTPGATRTVSLFPQPLLAAPRRVEGAP
jgi:biopolymer transport protein ExbD